MEKESMMSWIFLSSWRQNGFLLTSYLLQEVVEHPVVEIQVEVDVEVKEEEEDTYLAQWVTKQAGPDYNTKGERETPEVTSPLVL